MPFSSDCISSGFGPRIHPETGKWDRHPGIDFSQAKGASIVAVEGGTLDKIEFEGKAGWVIGVQGANRYWSYLHTFENESLIKHLPVGDFILGKDNDGKYIENINTGKRIYVGKALILTGIPFAPVGNSGRGTGPHLHLNLNRGKDNPLAELSHSEGAFAIKVTNPKEGVVLKGEDLKTDFPITVNVDMVKGKDLDKVTIFLDDEEISKNKDKFTFCYGGKVGEKDELMVESNGNNTGVKPIQNTFKRDFIYCYDFSNLEDGQHKLKVVAGNVNGNNFQKEIIFNVEKEYIGQISGQFLWHENYEHPEKNVYGSYSIDFITGKRSQWQGIHDVLLGLTEKDEISGITKDMIPQEIMNNPKAKEAISAFVPEQIEGKARIKLEAPNIVLMEKGKIKYKKQLITKSCEGNYILGFWSKEQAEKSFPGLIEGDGDSYAEIVISNLHISVIENDNHYVVPIFATLFSSKKEKDKYSFSNMKKSNKEWIGTGSGSIKTLEVSEKK